MEKLMYLKVGTHNGVFHADEVFAIALLCEVVEELEIVRSRDPKVLGECNMLVDVGMEFDEEGWLFDHHQSKDLESSNCMVLDWVKKEFPDKKWDGLDDFFSFLSMWDRNQSDVHREFNNFRNFLEIKGSQLVPEIIKMSNRDDPYGPEQEIAFGEAVDLAEKVIHAYLYQFSKQAQWDYNWGLAILHDSWVEMPKFVPDWKSRIPGYVKFALFPGEKEGQYKVTSTDANKFPIPDNQDGEIFLHANKFFAVYDTKENALKAIG